MPLHEGTSPEVVSENIREMEDAGHPHDQSVAAAMREKDESEGGKRRKRKAMHKSMILFFKADDPGGHVHGHGKLGEKLREDIGRVGGKRRQKMPEDVFLEPGERKYPVKSNLGGEWKYSPKLLEAAAREARMHGREDIAARADKIRAGL